MSRKFAKYVFLVVAVLSGYQVKSQQLPLYSQYDMNGFLLNPAKAGSDGFTTYAISSRDHMLGFDNSPKTYAFSFQTRLMRKSSQIKKNTLFSKKVSKRSGRVGLGGYIFNDKNGYVNRVGAQFSYAYHVYLQNTQVSFGLAASTFQFQLYTSDLNFRDPEVIYNQDFSNKILVPDVSTGTYVLSENYFLGLSIANLFQTRVNIGGTPLDYRMYRHYFLMGCWRFNGEAVYSFEPSFLLKGTEKMGFQADLQIRVYYNKGFYGGVTYRTGSAVGCMVGGKVDRFYFSYAFDYSLRSIQNYSYGSHELNVAVKLGDNARRYRWLIRY
jgi:type IX secretion system PorP/SprF family membrane protein